MSAILLIKGRIMKKKTSLILIKDLLMCVTVASNSNFLRVGFDKQIHTYYSNGVILIL